MTHQTAWTFQHPKEVDRIGEKKAAWNVGWYDPDGARRQKSCGSGSEGKKEAFRLKKKIEAELITGTYESKRSVSWNDFIKELREDVFQSMADENVRIFENVIEHFRRIVKPKMVGILNLKQIDKYIAARSNERGRKPGSTTAPATINKELRYLKSLLNYAEEWGYLKKAPKFKKRWVREPEKLPRFITEIHFPAIYDKCDHAQRPMIPNVQPAVWWRGLLIMAYMTGWRVDELISFKRKDLDLIEGTALTRHGDNKGKKDSKILLPEMVIDHLKDLHTFDEHVFPWPHNRRQLYDEFYSIQEAAEIELHCDEDHEHSESCKYYGFHDIRRAFATENVDTLNSEELQGLMRHQSYQTTQKYINMARKLRSEASKKVKAPNIIKKTS